MSSFERKIVRWIVRHRAAVLIAVATCLGALIRFSLRDVISKDMRMYLLPWFSQIRDNGGLRGLGVQVGNYNVAYQFIIALLTYLPLRPELLYKLVSVAFDFVLALGVGKLLYDVYGGKERFALAYSVTLLLPTVFLNSAAWGQCDSIYASLCVFCLDLLYLNFKEPKPRRAVLAFVALGFAFAMKLQTVFILPFVVYLYFQDGGGFGILHCLIPVAINLLLPVVLGRGPLSTLGIYLWQTRKYGATMSMNSPSVWLFLSQNAEHLKIAATAVALAVLGGGLFALLSRPGFLRRDANYVWVMLWSCWTCVMLLPCMHERYGYIVEVLLAAMAVADLRLFPFAVCVELCGMSTYGSYLFDLLMFDAVKPVAMIACVAAYAAFSGMLLWRVRRCGINRE